MNEPVALHVLLEVNQLASPDHVLAERNHLEGFLVHEVVQLAVRIAVLHRPVLQPDLVHPFAGAKGSLDHRSGEHVLQLRAYERAALARLDVLKVRDGVQGAIHLEGHPVAEIGSGCHSVSQ